MSRRFRPASIGAAVAGAFALALAPGQVFGAGLPDVAANALQNGTYDSDSIIVSGQATYTF